jgi:branched-chain amino acid transport system ATP-binding protein
VQDVSFDVAEGEIIALLGRNGAGKTSTLRTIARAGSPHLRSGEIWLQGTAVHEMESYQAVQCSAFSWCRKTGASFPA